MPPWLTIDSALTSDGGEMTLATRGVQFVIRVDGQDLMNSASHGSEEKLAEYGCAGLGTKVGARVLLGGLGMGFTARAALDALAADAELEVVELVGAVVRWNRDILGHLAGAPLGDARLRLVEADVAAIIAGAQARYDAVLLDVDNGPVALTTFENKRLYAEEGLRATARALRPGGVLAVWSLFEDARFSTRLRAAGFQVSIKRVLAGDGSGRRHVLWLANRAPPRAAAVV
jgi:spermidine synthase